MVTTGNIKQMPQQRSDKVDDNQEVERDRSFEVQSICGIRKVRGKIQYLVQWKGYSANEDSWESVENLTYDHLINIYHRDTNTLCQLCNFRALNIHGLSIHMKRHP